MTSWTSAAGLFSIVAASAPAFAQDNTMFVFDGSGSMWGQIDGVAKITIAQKAFQDLRDTWPAASGDVGLIAYGHRRKGDCRDIEQIVPLGADGIDGVMDAIHQISPRGKTPLSEAVSQAATAMNYVEDPATVILFSDGVETCNADPCALSAKLEAQGIDFTTHVIGFGISAQEDREQLRCIAENTGGVYRDAADAQSLRDALGDVADAALVTPANGEAAAPLREVRMLITLVDEAVRPAQVTLRATHRVTNERIILATLSDAEQVISGGLIDIPYGDWTIDAVSNEGRGTIDVTIGAATEVVNVPFAANEMQFSLIDNGPYEVGIEHGFFLRAEQSLQPNVELVVGLLPRGASSFNDMIDYEYRFGSDAEGLTYHTFAAPNVPGSYDVVIAHGDKINARFPVEFVDAFTPQWKGAVTADPGGLLDLRISGTTYYYNSFILSQDGGEVSRVNVDTAFSPHRWAMQMPQESGVYDLSYQYTDGAGTLLTTNLTTLVVGDVVLPDDADAVAPPSDTDALDETSNDAMADPALLRNVTRDQMGFACDMQVCEFDAPLFDIEGVPVHQGFGINVARLNEQGRPSFDLFNIENGEWLTVNPPTQSQITDCTDISVSGAANPTDLKADVTDRVCILRGSNTRTVAQYEALLAWMSDRNWAKSETAIAAEQQAHQAAMGEDDTDLQLIRTWTISDQVDQNGVAIVKITGDPFLEILSGSLLIINGAPLGLELQELNEAKVEIGRDTRGVATSVSINSATHDTPILISLTRTHGGDGSLSSFEGTMTNLSNNRAIKVRMN